MAEITAMVKRWAVLSTCAWIRHESQEPTHALCRVKCGNRLSPFTTASSKAPHKVISKHSTSSICWLGTCIRSWEMEGHSRCAYSQKTILLRRKLLNVDRLSQIGGTKWQKAKQWEGKPRRPVIHYIFSFRNCSDVLSTGDSFPFLQSLLKL